MGTPMGTPRRSHRSKGTGAIFQRADGRWVVRVELPERDGKRRRKQIVRTRKADAVTALRELRQELDKTGDLPTSAPTLAAWLDIWVTQIAMPRLKPRTLDTYVSYIERHIKPAIGRVRLDKLTPAHVRRLHDHMAELSPTSALQAHRILSTALRDALREGRITRNVADRDFIDAPRRAVSTRTALTAEQAGTLLRSVAHDPRAAVRWSLALLAGLRQGEALGVTRAAIDLNAGLLAVEWQLQRLTWLHGCGETPCGNVRGGSCPQRQSPVPPSQEAQPVGGLWLTRPKSRAGWRQIPLAGVLREVLTRYLETPPGPAGLLLHDNGKPLDPSADSAAWKQALADAGLPIVPLHSARHTCATLLHALGVDAQTRQTILGHSSAATTAGYTHIATPMMIDAMAKLDALVMGE